MTLGRGVTLSALLLLRAAETPASLIEPGMHLVYASDAGEQPAWLVESVERGIELRPGWANCADARIRTNPRNAADVRRHCIRANILFAWDTGSTPPRALRPIGARMSLQVLAPRGAIAHYETQDLAEETISGVRIAVIPTMVTTRDSIGRVVRRLRERYSVGLTTATGGVFEVPDSTSATGWRQQQKFELVRITRAR